jgi:O-acetyl-ADP-ribose deacetylase (regulator of RNase III)
MSYSIIKGDLLQLALDGYFDVIVHGCNCFNTMGAGVAGQISRNPKFSKVVEIDKMTKSGDWNKLGNFTYTHIENNSMQQNSLIVVNAYTQYGFGRTGKNLEYCALKSCLHQIANCFGESKEGKLAKIGMPKIGCGLGGGDWLIVEDIIKQEMHFCDVTIVEYENG